MLERSAYYYFKKEDETDLIEVIIRVAIGKHREWIHNRDIINFYLFLHLLKFFYLKVLKYNLFFFEFLYP